MSTNQPSKPSIPFFQDVLVKRWLLVLAISLLAGVIGRYYGIVVYGDTGHLQFLGFLTGVIIGFFVSIFEIFYIRSLRRSWFRTAAFLPGLIVRVLILTLLIRLGLILNGFLSGYITGTPTSFSQFKFSEQFRDTLFSLSIVVAFVVLTQLTALIGFKRFTNLVAGRYFKPVSEKRIFLFVDLVDSSELARKFGNVRFHEFLADFFYTVDTAIVRYGGEIVSYVGDSVIVTWPLGENKTKNARCLLALNQMRDDVENQKQRFLKNFNVAPEFRAALHGGEVVVGECGVSRKQITFLGDVVNTTARIEKATKEQDEQFLVSDILAQQMAAPQGVILEMIGETKLKGVKENLLLHRIRFSSQDHKTIEGL